jgi:hypothetical protein
MNLARKNNMTEPTAGDDAERDADRDRGNILNHMAWLQDRYDAERADKIALQSECRRLMAANAALIRAADKPPAELTEQTPDAPPDADDLIENLALGHPLRLRKLIEVLKPTPEWLSIKDAAYRSDVSVGRMGQLKKANKVIWCIGDGGRIFILTASVDKRLRKAPRIPPPKVLYPHQLLRTS